MRKTVFFVLLAVLSAARGLSFAAVSPPGNSGIFPSPAKEQDYNDIVVKKVIDGDTVVLENGEYVSLIGLETPECDESRKLYRDVHRTMQDARTVKEMGRKAEAFTRRLVEGKKVRLEFDVRRRDSSGRLLAYLYLPDGTFVNAEILGNGYASTLTTPPNVKYSDQLHARYNEARKKRRGLWGDYFICPFNFY